ncbi:MAG TPA: uracil phosphoribosyltransferase [Bacteroidetes bacterium]|mgnify:CR=1 FL=1|nr:uracil phosphoribosyltransferase [Ignavibacteria bacterium]HCA41912.1 uracil phosphoribosyltransferase [Bacteroidota bacterium]HCN37758.1 uracil phosphoribosyltransferase [Bacteroidota bacterium]
MAKLNILTHPLVAEYLTILRDKNTDKHNFCVAIDKISYFLAADIYKNLSLESYPITTPLKKTKGFRVKENVVIMPVLRAGLGFTKGFIDLYPKVKVSHIGIFRNEHTLQPVNYYFKFPPVKDKNNTKVIILEPMIATGGSAIYAIKKLFEIGIKKVFVASLIAAPEGIKEINNSFSKSQNENITVTVCAYDEKLNDKGYIVPGLGDAGDRMFGTV